MSARPCIARASRGGAHGRAWVRGRANSRAVQGSWCARMQPSTIATSLKSTGTEDARNALFGPFVWQGTRVFQFFIFWENRCLGSSSGTSKSQCTVLSSKKSFILKVKFLPVQAIQSDIWLSQAPLARTPSRWIPRAQNRVRVPSLVSTRHTLTAAQIIAVHWRITGRFTEPVTGTFPVNGLLRQ